MLISKLQSHKKLISVVLFLLLSVLFVISAPRILEAQGNAESAQDVYLFTDKETGFTPSVIRSLNCVLGSADCGEDGGAIIAAGGFIDQLYLNPPASAVVWAYDQYHQIYDRDLVAVYAQTPSDTSLYFPGLGYNVLSPMLGLWQWSRNIVYLFYVFIIIILAFLILFRQSLGGQTVVTIVNSLPSLIFSLVLVTLSYPIAAFFVDLVYIGTNVIQGVMVTTFPNAPGESLVTSQVLDIPGQTNTDVYYLQPDDPEFSIWAIWHTSNSNIIDCAPESNDPDAPINCVNNLLPDGIQDAGLLGYIGSILPIAGAASAASSLASTASGNRLLNLVLGIAAFMAAFKLFLSLLKAWATLALSPVYLPWVFLTAAFPNRTKSAIIGGLKPLLAASLTFIAVYALFMFMIILGQSSNFSGAFQNIGQVEFVPPLLGYSYEQITSVDSSITTSLLIFILFLAAPTLPEMINGFLDVQPSAQVGRAAQEVKQTTSKTGSQIFSGISRAVPGRSGG